MANSSLARCLSVAAGTLSLAAAFSAGAAMIVRHEIQNAAGLCQAALPSGIRNRPVAIANEGTTIAFVSCSLVGDAARPTQDIKVLVSNRSSEPVTITCSLIEGTVDIRTFFPKSVDVQPGFRGTILWTPADNWGTDFPIPNLQCALPPGVELNWVERNYKESTGELRL